MSNRFAFLCSVLVMFVALGVVSGCSAAGQSPELAEVYERMLAGMTQEGKILHSTRSFEVVDEQGAVVSSGETEYWVDVANDRYRREQRFFDNPELSEPFISWFARGDLYNEDGVVLGPFAEEGAVISSIPGFCPDGNSKLLYGFLECIRLAALTAEDLAPEIERSRTPAGAESLRVRFTFGPTEAEEGLVVFDLHLDPERLLPLIGVFGIELSEGVERGQLDAYQHEFISKEDLPEDFFGPVSIDLDQNQE